jgi:predicted Zn-dependent peptidase
MIEPFTNQSDFEEARERTVDRATIGFDNNFDTYAGLIWENISENRPVKDMVNYFSKTRRTLQSITLDEIEATRKEFFRPERFVTVVVEPK